jgi:hypothetical protein
MVHLAPTAAMLLDDDRLMVVESERTGVPYGVYRGLVPNLTYAVTRLETDDAPMLIEPEGVFGEGHLLGVRVASPDERPWHAGCHLMWFRGHGWWVEDSLGPEEATDVLTRHVTTPHRHLVRG